MVHLFVDSLFVHNTGIQYKTKFNHILAASVLQFYDAFPGIIGNGPYGKYNDRSHNPFHHNIVSVVFELNISGETFDKCKKVVIDGFNNKNWLGVNIEKIGSGYAKRYVDGRCVVSAMDKQGDAIGEISNTTQIASKEIKKCLQQWVQWERTCTMLINKLNYMQINSIVLINGLR